MEDCIFCKIIKGEIPCHKVYEDDEFIAFLDIGPVNKGHLLVLPKEHYENILEIPDDLLKELVIVCKNMAKRLLEIIKADGFNLMVNNKKAAGQLVDHLHFHIIPRFENDGFKHWEQGKYEKGEAEKLVKKFLDSNK